MGYMHIDNLYKSPTILAFRRCYALEKVHGTSAHIRFKGTVEASGAVVDGTLSFFSGGASHERFVELFDVPALTAAFVALGHPAVTVYGEAYGGKEQGMSATYGKSLAFIAFDVDIDGRWLDVPKAVDVVAKLGLEFVPFEEGPTDIAWLDAQRDAPSAVAVRRGIVEPKAREGVVLRPIFEVTLNNGNRVIAKHKGDQFRETKSPRVVDPEKAAVLSEAGAVAEEWVTEMRLTHVLDKIAANGPEDIPKVIAAMVEDVMREGVGEIVDSREVRKAIGAAAAKRFQQRLRQRLFDAPQ